MNAVAKEKSPRGATNTSGLYGMVIKGLPNHLNTHCLGEDGDRLYQSGVDRQAKTLQFFVKGYAMNYIRIKTVFVRRYIRRRFGRWESVCQHWRSHPGQMSLF